MTAAEAPEEVQRLHRTWHAALGLLVSLGWHPRRLTKAERRAAQRAIFGAESVWDTPPGRAMRVQRRLSDLMRAAEADPAAVARLAVVVWLHGVEHPTVPDTAKRAIQQLARDAQARGWPCVATATITE